MEHLNSMLSTKLRQVKGGTTVKQGDSRSAFKYELMDYSNTPLTHLNGHQASIRLHRFHEIFYEKNVEVIDACIEFTIDKILKSDNYSIEVICGDYVLPSDQNTTIFISLASDKYIDSNLQVKAVSNSESSIIVNYDDSVVIRKIAMLENELQQLRLKQTQGTVYDDTEVKRRLETLENRPIATTSEVTAYDDTEIKQQINAFNSRVEETIKAVTSLNEVRASTTSSTGKVSIIKTPIEYTLIKDKYVSHTNGVEIVYKDWSMTDYIDVSNTQMLIVKHSNATNYNAWYDVDKRFIKAFGLGPTTNILEKPENAKFVRISDATPQMSRLKVECWKFEIN